MKPHHPVILPGWGLGRGPLTPLAESLEAELFDLPGYGGSTPIPESGQAISLLASQLPESSPVIGWSLGAMLALACAATHPGKIGKLVLIDGTASFCRRDHWPDGMPPSALADFSVAALSDFVSLRRRFIHNLNHGEPQARALSRKLMQMAEPAPPASVLEYSLQWLHDLDLGTHLPFVRCPVLLIHGARDTLMPLSGANRLAAQLAQARLTVLPEAAHAPFLSQPEHVLDLIRAFL